MFQLLTSALSTTAPAWSLAETPRARISGVRRECAECGAHVMAGTGRGNRSGTCTVCGGCKLFRLDDRAAKK